MKRDQKTYHRSKLVFLHPQKRSALRIYCNLVPVDPPEFFRIDAFTSLAESMDEMATNTISSFTLPWPRLIKAKKIKKRK